MRRCIWIVIGIALWKRQLLDEPCRNANPEAILGLSRLTGKDSRRVSDIDFPSIRAIPKQRPCGRGCVA
jgi:hypothetical protein